MSKYQPNYFEEYIRRQCKLKNLPIETLADRIGMSRGTFYALLKPKSNPKLTQLLSIAEILNIHYDILIQLKWKSLAQQKSEFHTVDKTLLTYQDSSAFISETIPDGTIMDAGYEFEKTWTIQNIGQEIWQNRFLQCQNIPTTSQLPEGVSADDYYLIPESDTITIPTTYPHEIVTLAVKFKTPNIAGHYISYWKMVNQYGELCFPKTHQIGLSTLIVVKTLGTTAQSG